MDGDILASGRDADILELGRDRVVRRARDGRSIATEAAVMEHVRVAGYPAPQVFEVRAGGTEIVMERLVGPSMMQLLGKEPWRLGAHAATLARLHSQLGEIAAPDSIRQLADGGDRVVHLDLHPLNVMMTAAGPVVIDWANASRGEPVTDVATTWVIMQSSEITGSKWDRVLGKVGRSKFLSTFLRMSGVKTEAEAILPETIDTRLMNRNLTTVETIYLRAWRERVAA